MLSRRGLREGDGCKVARPSVGAYTFADVDGRRSSLMRGVATGWGTRNEGRGKDKRRGNQPTKAPERKVSSRRWSSNLPRCRHRIPKTNRWATV